MPQKVYVNGFPGLYGGASTELHHQIPIWQELGLEVHLVPTRPEPKREPLYDEMVQSGVFVHDQNQFEVIDAKAPVLGFCSRDYLQNLGEIRKHSTNTVFVNCMTWLFEEERRHMAAGWIRAFLYQNEDVKIRMGHALREINPVDPVKFLTFTPYFDDSRFPFRTHRSDKHFGCGRISRQDTDKYAARTMQIYETFVAPVAKQGLFVGWNDKSLEKTGSPPSWVRTTSDMRQCSQQQFYAHCEIVLQPMDTTENWPRVGLEAMASGSVLIVDNRGGWQKMVEHKKTGFLCDSPRDFIYYASRMAYEADERRQIAESARARGQQLASRDASRESWKKVFEAIC